MGRVIVTEFVSLDGVMEAPGGEGTFAHSGWVFDFQSEDQAKYKLDENVAAEALLLGRVTYEGFAAAWPQRDDEAGFARKFNTMPKYVVTSTLTDLEWENSHVLEGDVATSVPALKERIEGEIQVHGSRTLAQALMQHGLVDEYHLLVFPVVLGSGRRLYPEGPERLNLRLAAARPFESGVVALTYHPA